ncbi:MAG TPA: GAF domain-containing protein, partial [Anaerolineae bacterium]|nr:GAF domain-containing protein [Anaerolineae bacterium]
ILEILADQAAVAIQNARLYGETERRYEQTQLLLRVAGEIGSTLDLTETVRRVAREMCRALGADMAGVYLPTEEGTHLRAVAGYHIPHERLEFYRSFLIPLQGQRFLEEAWQSRQAVYTTDPANDPRIDRRTIDALPNETVLFAPMVARDEVVGGVYVTWSREKRELTEEDLQLANAIAWQAGVVVENSRLFDAQQRQVRELGILFETSAAVSSSLALGDVLGTVAEQMARALDVTSCTISDWDPESEVVTTLVARTADPGLQGSPMTGDIGVTYSLAEYQATAAVLRTRRPGIIRMSDPKADAAERALLEHFGQKSLLMLPLVAHDNVVGLVELYENRRGREFTDDDVRLGTVLANQAAIAIENARLYEQTDERLQARVDELTALQRVTRELNASLALDHVVEAVLDAAIESTQATHGNVMLLDLTTGHLTLRATRGYTEEEAGRLDRLLIEAGSQSIVQQVIKTGEAYLIEDTETESLAVCVKEKTRAWLSVPILYEGLVVGAVNLAHTAPGAFDGQALAFVQSRTEQAALAIGNAMRFEEQLRANDSLRARSEQMASLLEVSRKLRTDVPLDEVLEEVAYAIQETVGFDVVLISVREGIPPVMWRAAAAGLPIQQFQALRQVRQPAERFEALFRDEYRLGACYFFPFDKREDWGAELHTIVPMTESEEWEEGRWHPHDMLLVPLYGGGGRLLGHISLDQPRDGLRPSRRTLNTLAIFSNQAAIAVENAHLYADAQRRAENLELINEVGRSLTQVLDPNLVQTTVVRAVCALLKCEFASLFQLDPVDGKLAAAASHGAKLAELKELRFAVGEGLVGHVAATREALLVSDTSQDPRFVNGPVPVGAMLLAPVVAGGELIGVLTAGSPHPQALTRADQVLLATLADQTAVALESARLFDTTQQAALRLSLLNEIGRRAAAELHAGEMLDTSVQALQQNLGFFRVAAFLLDEGSGQLYAAAANDTFWPVIPKDFRLAVGEGLIGRAAETGETVLVNDTTRDPRYCCTGDWECAASLSVPIKVGDTVIGVLHTEAARPMAFREGDAAALEIAADQLAVALQNARLFHETQRRVAELATINEIGRAISSALDAAALYELIYNQVSNLLDTSNFHVALYDPAQQSIQIEFLVEHGRRQEPVVLQLGQGLTSHLIRTGEPILLTHGSGEFLSEHGLSLERDPARSWLGVPMIAEDRVIGAIAVQSFDKDEAFDQGHLELLTTIAGQAAVAFQNVRLFEERDRRIGELAVLNEVSRAMGATLDLDQTLEIVYQQASRLVDATNFYIALYNGERDEITFPFVVDPEGREDWSPRKGGRGLTGRVIAAGEPLLLPEGAAGIYREQGMDVRAGLCRSWLGVPMIAEDRVLGVIAVQSYEREHVYGADDLKLLATVASQSAMAVRNAQLY